MLQSTVSIAVSETPGEKKKRNYIQISISEILKAVSAGPITSNSRRSGGTKKQHSEVLTSTPMKKTFEAKKQKKLSQKEEKKYDPKRSAAKRSDAKKKLPKKLFESSSEDNDLVMCDNSDDELRVTERSALCAMIMVSSC